jgi:hypothetical protein
MIVTALDRAGHSVYLGNSVRSIWVIRFGLFGFVIFWVLKIRTENFKIMLGTEPKSTHNFGSVYSVHQIDPNSRETSIFKKNIYNE